jgi:cobalt-zinc-cadmium efflux system outer membrane protein
MNFKHFLNIEWCLLLSCTVLGCATSEQSARQNHYLAPVDKHMLNQVKSISEEVNPDNLRHSLDGYLEYAALRNPALQSAFAKWKAALERIPQAKSLPDPKFNYGYYIQEVETRVGPQNQRVGLAQTFPWFGTLSLKEGKAADEARMAQKQYDSVKVRLFYQVKDAYYEYYYLRRAIEITQENIELLKRLESVAQAKVRAGGDSGAVVKAQVEIGKLEDRLKSLQDFRSPVVAKLNTTMGLPSEELLPWPGNFQASNTPLDKVALLQWLDDTNPDIQSLELQVKANEKAIQLARKKFYPDVTLGLDYISTGDGSAPVLSDRGKDPIMAMFSINIPLWNRKNRAGLREAKSRREASVYALEDAENRLASELEMAWFAFQDAERKRDLYRNTLTPLAENSLSVAQESYESGRSDFLEWIDAQRLLLEFQLSYERALADREQSLAGIEQIVGQEITPVSIKQQKEPL